MMPAGGRGAQVVVELRGFEPLTFSLRMASGLVGLRFGGQSERCGRSTVLHVLHRGGNNGATPGARASASCVQLGKMEDLSANDALAPRSSVLGRVDQEAGAGRGQ